MTSGAQIQSSHRMLPCLRTHRGDARICHGASIHPTRSQQFSASSKLPGQLDISLIGAIFLPLPGDISLGPTDKFKFKKCFLTGHTSQKFLTSLFPKGPRQMALLPLVTVITSADLGSIAVPPGLIHIFSRGSLENRLI